MTVVRALGDVPTAVTYVQIAPGVYNPATGLTADVPTSHPITVPLLRLLESEMSWFPAPDKVQRAVVPFLTLSITTTRNDYFLISGVRWEIKRVRRVPTGAVTIFYIESP